MSLNVPKIVEAIKAKKCILVLGPEICSFNHQIFSGDTPQDFDKSLEMAYHYYNTNGLDEELDKDGLTIHPIQFFEYPFLKENLLTNNLNDDENHLYNFVKWYFKQTKDWEQPFAKISQIPFPLVLSLLPDTHLEKSFDKTFQNNPNGYMLSRYSRLNKEVPAIAAKPTWEKPLLYKLLGDLEEKDSTFTFDHWFDFFNQIFKDEPALPTHVINTLKEASMILFLGVRLEKWYIQLLIRLLFSLGSVKGKKLAFVNMKENKMEELAKKRFNLIFDEQKPIQLLNELYQVCQQEGLLRTTSETTNLINTKVFISYNHADKALANRLKDDLEKIGIEIIIDSDNPIGFDIPTFINQSINKAEFVLQLISENFLSSAWVAQESIKAFTLAEITGKVVLPCEIDDVLNNNEFRTQAMNKFESQLGKLKTEIGERLDKGESFEDLQAQYQRILELKNNYDKTIAEFRKKNRGDLRGNNYEIGLKQIISSIKTYQAGNV
ncbi:toll/interleukin-1 receptor domain-containing protein [Arcicella rigui]|uniref:Toll/interleukin-1 receptor domain-containing protein n=1 Tax=Arcicella rigui TaxID=797020 RepID=A0ABU5QFS3_9BACT|nr:toll/interleukin-1 receptor domain-containing protein [Arcicella rigui]MEA5141734.1 toll/interleukin-1 receptor domain-containing protein [Arcicella rigui]